VSAHLVSEEARTLHASSIVIDTHADTTQRLLDPEFNISARHSDGNVDLPRMRESGLTAIFFAIWTPSKTTGAAAVNAAKGQIDAISSLIRKHSQDLVLATSPSDIREAKKQNKIAVLMAVEGGHMIGNDLSVLRTFSALGVSYMTLTHLGNTEWADSATDKPVHNGLSNFGTDVVREMNRLGMIVDVSHLSDKAFYDVIAVSKAPVFASHSSCRVLCNSVRNLTDDMMRDLAKNGGVIQINYHVGFLSQAFRDFEAANPDVEEEINAEVKKRCGDLESRTFVEGDQVVRDFMEAGKLPKVDWTLIVDHIDHAVKIAGADHVGLGSDFDGAVMPLGMQDVSHLPQITDALLKRGYSETDIRKILGENTLRLLRLVEQVRVNLNQ
jgi:membrane dipeptidase